MSPRPYRLGQRQAATEQTRSRIIDAARELFMSIDDVSGFSMDAVARQANVARMTVYHQFGSKTGLLEALCDSLAMSGGMKELAATFSRSDAYMALDDYIAVFGRFWQSDRLVTRRLRALAALDVEFDEVIRGRDERRRAGLRVIVQRISEEQGRLLPEALEEIVQMLYTLTGFEFFDILAGPSRTTEEIVPIVQKIARGVFIR